VNFDGRQIAEATGGQLVQDGPSGPVLTDTRSLAQGSWFLALVGDRFDGHDFLERAAVAAGCIVDRPVPDWQGGVVQVADTTRAIQDLGRAARDRLTGPVVALTGSSGKTTTRALIALALEPMGSVHQTVGNLNNHLGVPMTLLAGSEQAAVTVVEMGTSSPGEIAVLADIARPDVRLLLNVGPAHLEELGGLEGVAREKGALLASARPGDTVVLNADDPFVANQHVPEGVRVVRYGRAGEVRLLEASLDSETLHTAARIEVPGQGTVHIELPTPGLHIAHNAAAALAVAFALGVPAATAAAALSRYEPVGMRLRVEPLPQGALAINDAYNANPQSTEASLRTLAQLPGRRVAVLGDMLELGAEEAAWHERTGALAASLGLDLVVLVGPRMAAAAAYARGRAPVWAAEDGMELVERLRAWLRPGDRVLFKGSRGARVERIVHALQEPAPRAGRTT
jgi:UDP-N-acetylmuramoyl-tripeptide--D-alanyl-D-alanine ligase